MEPVENYFKIIHKELTFLSTNKKMSLPVNALTVKIHNSKMQHCFCNILLSMSIKDSSSVSQRIKIMKPGEQCNSLCGTVLD